MSVCAKCLRSSKLEEDRMICLLAARKLGNGFRVFAFGGYLQDKKCEASHIPYLAHPEFRHLINCKMSGSLQSVQPILKMRLSIPPRNPGILKDDNLHLHDLHASSCLYSIFTSL